MSQAFDPILAGPAPITAQQAVDKGVRPLKHSLTADISPVEKSELVQAFMGVYNSRDQLIKTLMSLRSLDAVQTILDVVIDDGFINSTDSDLFKITYDPTQTGDPKQAEENQGSLKQQIDEHIADFVKAVQLNTFVKNIIEDLLLIGEYPFRLEIQEGKGIVGLKDDLEVSQVLAFFENNRLDFFMEKKGTKIVKRNTDDYALFVLSPRKVRIKLNEKSEKRRQIGEYLRIGRSIIYPAITKLKRLQIQEMCSVADSLKKMLLPTVVSVGVPANATPDDVRDTLKVYEKNLQSPAQSLENPDALEFSDLFDMVGRIKLIPSFSDGKGNISTVDYGKNENTDADEKEQKLRVAIAMAVGVPSYYLAATGEGGVSKLDTLKVFSRYSRKLVSLQDSIAQGVKALVVKHLALIGINVSEEALKVKFKSLVNMDLLDSVEFAVASVNTLQEMFQVVESIANSSAVKIQVNSKKFVKFAEKFLVALPETEGMFEAVENKEPVDSRTDMPISRSIPSPMDQPSTGPDTGGSSKVGGTPKIFKLGGLSKVKDMKDVKPIPVMPTPVNQKAPGTPLNAKPEAPAGNEPPKAQ